MDSNVDGKLDTDEQGPMVVMLLLFARLINPHVEVFRSFGRRSPWRFYCQSGRLRRAVEKVVGVMRPLTAVLAMVVRIRVYSIHVLTKDLAVTGAQLCEYGSCLLSQGLFGCSNGRRSAIKLF